MFKPSEKIILTDCDGVLLDWEVNFHKWMSEQGYVKHVDAVYDISKAYGIPADKGHRLVKEYNASAWMGFLPALRDSRSGVATLLEAGYRFLCITSLSTDPMAKRLRWMNLNDKFGREAFVDLVCLPTGGDKDDALEQYRDSGLWWLEDKKENAVLGADLGLRSLLINHPHNASLDDERIPRFDTWKQITKHIISNDK